MNLGALDLDVAVTGRDLAVSLRTEPGEVIAVLGPNGAGKTTLLSVISGLLRPDSGRLTLDGKLLVDVDRRIFVPPHRRGVVLLAQQAMLFPHLTAAANVAFGPRSKGRSRLDARREALRWLAEVDAVEFAERRPSQLSGGQAQRIAVARALAADPTVLLLDEPMAALDVAMAPTIRQLLRRVLRHSGRTSVLVTHDILDALALADRTVVLEAGRIVEDGPTRAVLTRPRSMFAARLAGVNLVAGTATRDGLKTAGQGHFYGILDATCAPGDWAVAVFNPNAVAVHLTPPTGSPRNHLPVTIAEIEPRGSFVRVGAVENSDGTAGLFADLTARAVTEMDLVPGQQVYFAIKATEVSVYPRAG